MISGIYVSALGMLTNERKQDVIANNLANVNTPGFKKSRADFMDLMYQTLYQPGSTTNEGGQIPTGIQIGMGTMPASIHKEFSQGDFQHTENELDLAIEGRGFFKVLSNGEELYTRAGNFKLDSEGNIVTSRGDKLQPEITIPPDTVSIHIDKNGVVTAFGPDGGGTNLGVIELYTFPNPAGLLGLGHNLYRPTEASGEPISGTPGTNGIGTIAQGYLEMSNVNVVEELVSMIMAQRAYELNSKAIKVADEMMQMANNIKR